MLIQMMTYKGCNLVKFQEYHYQHKQDNTNASKVENQ